jgi:DNA modification methylase
MKESVHVKDWDKRELSVDTYRSMELVTYKDYQQFIKKNMSVTIGKSKIRIGHKKRIKSYGPPKDYVMESETVWSFPDRGDWATHTGNYRGNWSPYVPRNLISRFTKPSDVVLDQMVGSGTTLVECKLLGRRGIGVDINRDAIMVTLDRLDFCCDAEDLNQQKEFDIEVFVGDARNLNKVKSGSVDLVATHPPYAGIITYTRNRVEGDLSSLGLEDYLEAMKAVAYESLRVLKPGRHCAVLIGDTRRHLHYMPISKKVLEAFLDVGFVLREDVIKLQWKTKMTREQWRGKQHRFYKIAHEHLYIFRKPEKGEKLSRLRYSSEWLNERI